MKKIIFISILLLGFTLIKSQTFVRKPLHGTYVEIVSDTSLHIYTEDAIFSQKTYPTNFYWVEIDSMVNMNIRQLDQQGTVQFTVKFRLYWDYWSYWNWYNPFRLKKNPVFLTSWIDICAGDGYDLCSNFDLTITTALSSFFNYPINKFIVYSY